VGKKCEEKEGIKSRKWEKTKKKKLAH